MRATNFAVRALLALVLALLLPAAWAGVPNNRAQPAYAEEQTIMQAEQGSRAPEPGLASGESGRVHIDRHFLGQYGATEGDVILQRGGNTWRVLRNGPIGTTAGTLFVLALVGIGLFYLAVGTARQQHPDSGRKIVRFSNWDRLVHWATAISFLLLAFTGLIILFGKVVLRPWMGAQVFSALAYLSKYVHNFFGPLFILCSLVMFFTFLRRNFFNRLDWQWFREGGGIVSHKHVRAGFFNAGEKAWFWLGITLLGLVMSITGLILDFTNMGQTRYILQVANYFHIGGATLYIIAAMGHIYIGTIGTEGAYHAMRYGTVDEEWARQHHEAWYDQVKAGGAPPVPPDGGRMPPPSTRPGAAT
ncbi:formate dehydrogenase subunit gamma [Massilia solisilvae]|uniref:Formate dehydrogenase subunit gamma n=1 Tax=Massilia solisilvae TaxID=1811225 RepID=A0ABT2BGS7_9BURK|nr:formate dehydrogenase subunit gamma [Massilia solisilvae]MCS0607719.1 formate dehydrogenase subunit gamma [Massilia solisilvae]